HYIISSLFMIFSFYSSCHHLHLHSFPTRRSSDLFSVPPFQFQQLEKPGIHTILNSYDAMDGPHTFTVAWTTAKFREANPALYKRSEEHTSELQSHLNLVCRLLLEKKKNNNIIQIL